MKAASFNSFGDPLVFEYGEHEKPSKKEDCVLVKVKATSINRIDIWQRTGKYSVPLPHIAGSDLSGILEDGQEVILNPALACGSCERCKKNWSCEWTGIFGFSTEGAYAEWACVPKKNLYPKPTHLSFIEAACLPLTFLTAWNMLVTRACLQAGETVFIWGAAGGLGSAGVKIAKVLGARVIAATRDPKKVVGLKALGADEVCLFDQIASFEPVDVVFESVGQETWEKSISMLKPFGRLVIAGTTSGKDATLNLQNLYGKQLSILGARMGSKDDFEAMLDCVNRHQIKPAINRFFPLSDIVNAHIYFEKGEGVGKVALQVS